MVRNGHTARPRRGPARRKTPSAVPACLPEGFAETILDALSAHIAILDCKGVILKTNRAWREFAKANGKQIAELLGVAAVTVNFHRKNLSKKLDIGHSPVNLRAYLLSLK